jgi:hypothetical protein
MGVKLLISGVSNSGKTTLTNSLEDVLVIYHDGKKYPFPKPHTNIDKFANAEEFNNIITAKVKSYKEKFGALPKTVVIDSVSKVFDTIYDACNERYTGFAVYSNLNKELHIFVDFIESALISNGINIVIISHAIYDADTTSYTLVSKGDFQKRGSFLAETDNAIFLETKANKRIVHHRSAKFPARSMLAALPDNQPVEEYNLQEHIDMLTKTKDLVADFIID